MQETPNALIATLTSALGGIAPGGHLCSIGESENEGVIAAALTVRLGLERGERCIYVVDESAQARMRDALIGSEVDVAAAIEGRKLQLLTPQAAGLKGDGFDTYRMFTFWRRAAEQAGREGLALRALSETGWLHAGASTVERWMAYESGLTQLAQDVKGIFLCNYRRSEAPVELLPDIVRAHPLVIHQGELCGNIYHAAEEELAGSTMDVDRLLDTLRQHQQALNTLQWRHEELLQQEMRLRPQRNDYLNGAEQAQSRETLRETQAALSHASRMMTLGELTASIAHEVAQPLASMITDTAAALRWLTAGASPNIDEARQALLRITSSGNRAREVINRIRSLVKKAAEEKELLSINAIIVEVISLMEDEIERSGVVLRTELDAALASIWADRVQIQQVLLNLIVNAVEAINMRQEGPREIAIHAHLDGSEWAHIAVRDSGVGLGPGDPQRLFDPFFTTKPHGMGVGLSISRRIVQAHEGNLWVERNEADAGATFHITLPVRSPK